MKAKETEFVGISARVTVIWSGSPSPGRTIVIATFVPFGPFSFLTTASIGRSSIGCPSTRSMMSPARIPSLWAGEPSTGVMTVTRPFRFEMMIPSP